MVFCCLFNCGRKCITCPSNIILFHAKHAMCFTHPKQFEKKWGKKKKNEKKLLKTRVLQLMELGPEYASDKLESHTETGS